MKTGNKTVSIILHAFIALSTIIITISSLLRTEMPADSVVTGFNGAENLVFYTVDSNILAAAGSVLIILFLLFRNGEFPYWLHIFILTAVVSVGVTFCTVAFLLAPGQAMAGRGYFSLFRNNNLFFHLLNPVAAMIGFIRFIPHRKYTVPQCFFGVIPTALYSVFYTLSVVVFRKIPDFYNFTFGGHFELAPVSVTVMLALSFVLALVFTRLHNRLAP